MPHTLTFTCTCCCDEIKGTQDQDFSCSFSDSLSDRLNYSSPLCLSASLTTSALLGMFVSLTTSLSLFVACLIQLLFHCSWRVFISHLVEYQHVCQRPMPRHAVRATSHAARYSIERSQSTDSALGHSQTTASSDLIACKHHSRVPRTHQL